MNRIGRPRVGIAHQTVWAGDAIGNDIAGEHDLLTRCGYDVTILCQVAHPLVRAKYRVVDGEGLARAAHDVDLLLYHHSIHWAEGEALIASFRGPVVVKYHNITPEEYFSRYTDVYASRCREGRRQTARLAALDRIVAWQCDSGFNSEEIGDLGVPAEKRCVVPPFTRVDDLLTESHAASYNPTGPLVALFVGRRVPNKGHVHLLRTLAAWQDLFPEIPLACRIVGVTDAQLAAYHVELRRLEARLGLHGRVEWLNHVTNDELDAAFRQSHVYLNLSAHEGFCVPVIEAQALGLPVVSTSATALGETLGERQVAVPVPSSQPDYDLIAGLVHEVCTQPALRDELVGAGLSNVQRRFTTQVIEDRFLETLAPTLELLRP